MSEVGKNILKAMKEKGLSYGELSKMTGIGKTALQGYATGRIKKIPSDRLSSIATALEKDLGRLMGWSQDSDLVVAGELHLPKETVELLRAWTRMTDLYTGVTLMDLLSELIQNKNFQSMMNSILLFQNKDSKWWQEKQKDLQAQGKNITSSEAAKQSVYTEILKHFGDTLTEVTTGRIPTYHKVTKKKDKITISMRDDKKIEYIAADHVLHPDRADFINFSGDWSEQQKADLLEGLLEGLKGNTGIEK